MTLEPYNIEANNNSNLFILHVNPVPLSWSFDIIYDEFSKFGVIKEIRNRTEEKFRFFETWIIYDKAEDALRALNEFKHETVSVKCSLVEDFPLFLDIFRPLQPDIPGESPEITRSPDPPSWIILTTRSQHGNLFKVKKLINQKLGHVNRPDITRFGRNSFLIHTKSCGQAAMLLNLKLDPEGLVKDIKPHFNFSYARGVIFNEDIYELPEHEILDMCPDVVWKIFKVPRSSMIIFTFIDSNLPSELILENVMVRVRPYRPRVLQCFNCYGFGHASRVCVRDKICGLCSQPEHGECAAPKVCANCKGDHSARDKECKIYKKEQEALLKSIAEHISVGHAKKLLSKTSYSDMVKVPKPVAPRTGNDVSPASHAGSSQTNHPKLLEVSTLGTSQASAAEAPQALNVEASKSASDGANKTTSDGVPQAPSTMNPLASLVGGSKNSSSGMSGVSSGAPQGSLSPEVRPIIPCPVDTGGRTNFLFDLDEFSLPGSLPDIENSPVTVQSSPVVIVHRSNNNEEMEALSVRQKRSLTPPSPKSSSCASRKENDKKEKLHSIEDQSSKNQSYSERLRKARKKDRNQSGKISLSRPLSDRSGEASRIPKPK